MELPILNLPGFDIEIRKRAEGDVIWDPVRRKFVYLTPEEWVRQHFIRLLTEKLNYPRSMLSVEAGLSYNRKKKRSDIRVYKGDKIMMLIECKSWKVPLDQSVLTQISIYNKSLQAPYIAITNGMKHFIWQLHPKERQYEPLTAFPPYPS